MGQRVPRILIVEDETLIALYLQELVVELGCDVVGPIVTLPQALDQARLGAFDAAILDLIIGGEQVYSVAEILAERGIPFGFASGVPHEALDRKWRDRPFLDKPFDSDDVRELLGKLLDGNDLQLAPYLKRSGRQELESGPSP